MDAEIQFFMTEKDESDFLDYASTLVDRIDKNSMPLRLIMGDCELFFTPSSLEENTLFAGKLEIRLSKARADFKDLERAKSVFRKLRNKIKKNYWSRLAYLDKNKNDKLTPSRVHWLGVEAKKWKEADPEKHVLKLSKTSWMVFEIGF